MDPRIIETIRAGRGLPSHASEALEVAYSLQEKLINVLKAAGFADNLVKDLMKEGGFTIIPAPEGGVNGSMEVDT